MAVPAGAAAVRWCFACGAIVTIDLPPIDEARTPIGQALAECEIYCVSACCGMDAYEISSQHLQRWVDRVSRSTFDQVRAQVDRAIESLECAPASLYFLDAEHSREEVLAWFRQVQAAFAGTRPAV